MPFPKADRTKQKKAGRRKKGNARVYTDTPVRNEVAEAKSLSKKTVERKEKVKSRKSLFATGVSHVPKDVTSSDSDTSVDFQLADESDDEISDDEVIEGDFVVIRVKIQRTDRAQHFIARVDVIDDKEYEGIFLRRLSGKVQAESITFVPDEEDAAFFSVDDIVHKLPTPRKPGGSARKSCQMVFNCNLQKWSIE